MRREELKIALVHTFSDEGAVEERRNSQRLMMLREVKLPRRGIKKAMP